MSAVLTPSPEVRDTRSAWLEARRLGIGASDAPNLVGVGFADALHVYRSKVDPPDLAAPTGRLKRGCVLEDVVAEEYAEAVGERVISCMMHAHPDRPWQLATPDRKRVTDGRFVEIKTVSRFQGEWGQTGTADVPAGYWVQCQQVMGVTGTDAIDLAALDVSEWELRVFRVEFDADFFRFLTLVEREFWERFVLPRQSPPAGWGDQFAPRASRTPEPGPPVELPDSAVRLLMERDTLKVNENRTAAAIAAIDRDIKQMMGAATAATCPGWTVKRVVVPKKHVPAHTVPASTRAGYESLRITAAKESA